MGPKPWPVNNGISVDLISWEEAFRGLIEIAVGNCSEIGLPDFFLLFPPPLFSQWAWLGILLFLLWIIRITIITPWMVCDWGKPHAKLEIWRVCMFLGVCSEVLMWVWKCAHMLDGVFCMDRDAFMSLCLRWQHCCVLYDCNCFVYLCYFLLLGTDPFNACMFTKCTEELLSQKKFNSMSQMWIIVDLHSWVQKQLIIHIHICK